MGSIYAQWREDLSWPILTTEFFLHALRDAVFRREFLDRYDRHRTEVSKLLATYLELAGADASRAPEYTPMLMGMALGYALQAETQPKAFKDRPFGDAIVSFIRMAASDQSRGE